MSATARRIAAFLTTVWRSITATGRTTLIVGIVAWIVGRQLGWEEFMLVAAGCVLAVAIALLFTFGSTDLSVALELEPRRVVVGEQAVGRVLVTNAGRRRTLATGVEAPVGPSGFARFHVPSLAGGASWDDVFVVETERRSIMAIGPVSSVRGDPLGLARRTVVHADPIELFVHPRTVRLTGMTSGWIRDLEGRPTNDLSSSDVAFHTLREYVPGDDRRHIHWRTTARIGKHMVRQFVDSRRSHLGLVLSTNPSDYSDDDEFELAVSIVGSLGVSALIDDQAVTLTTGDRPLPAHGPMPLLDALAGVEAHQRRTNLASLAQHALPLVRGASVVALVTGCHSSPPELRVAAQRFHHDVRVLGIRACTDAELRRQTIGSISVLEVGALEQLARMLRMTVSR